MAKIHDILILTFSNTFKEFNRNGWIVMKLDSIQMSIDNSAVIIKYSCISRTA